MTSRGRTLVELANKQVCSGLDDCKSSIVSGTESESCCNPDKWLNNITDINNENYSEPVSVASRITYTDNLATIDANINKNNVQSHTNFGNDPCSLNPMDNQGFKGCITGKYNHHIDKSLNKVLRWLNNNSEIKDTEDKTDRDLSNKNYHSRDCDAENLNKSFYSAKTDIINGISLENLQSKNDKQLPKYGTDEISNSFQKNINLSDDFCPLDYVEDTLSAAYTLDKNYGNMSFLSNNSNWLISQEKGNEDVCKEKKLSPPNKQNEGPNTFISQKHENKDDLNNCESESMDTIGDDSRDKDFDIHEYTEPESEMCSSVNSVDIIIPPANRTKVTPSPKLLPVESLIENIQEQKKKDYRNKQFRCKFCNEDVSSRNFVRHLERRHNHEKEVRDVISFPLHSKERKCALETLRNDSNFDLYLNGKIRPKKQLTDPVEIEYYPCIYCKAIFSKSYLNRHVKKCIGNRELNKHTKVNIVSSSQTKVACALDPTDVISKLAIKNEVLNMMRGDEISFVAKKDLLIMHYGETYLKSQKRERREYSCSNKIRELARLLLTYRSIVRDNSISFKDLLHPKNFDNVLSATRQLCGYDPNNKTYKTPSLAMHTGTTLKLISGELIHLILREAKGFQSESKEMAQEWHKNVKNFQKLVEARWNKEIASVANKDLNEKRWRKPLLVPLINDVKLFKEGALDYARECEKQFLEKNDTEQTYKLLVQCTLSLIILFNRRRIGDVQYLKVEDYKSERKSDFQDFEATLSESEKVLTKQYKRVVNGGKGSRAVVILIPPMLQNFMDLLLLNREKYISYENRYVFALPNSTLKWAQGDVAIRNLTTKIKLENPQAISSNKLRKHIATAMQVLTMSKNDCKQFSKFMGHTEKTHEEFYELPVDVFQTARVVKLLIMMEKGIPIEFKGKTLSEIELKPDEYIEDDNEKEEIQARENENSRSNDETKSDDNLPLNIIGRKSSDRNNACAKKKERNIREGETESDDDLPLTKIARKLSDRNNISVKKKQQNIRKGWTSEEVQLVKNHFKSFLAQNTYPPSDMIKEFIKINNLQRSVLVIKSKIQHLFRLKNKI